MNSFNFELAQPWMLALLPLAALPLVRSGQRVLTYPWLELIPRDAPSVMLGWALRVAAALAIAALVLGLAGLRRSQVPVEKVGRGTQIVLLLDRSRSMDESFTSGRENIDPRDALSEDKRREKKGVTARRLLAEFAARRNQDMFGMVVFSAQPIRVLDFTRKPEAIQAAIRAAGIGRGLAETEIGSALLAALEYWKDQPYAGSRIVLLVSDGGARIDETTQRKIANLMKRSRVALYWIYLRGYLHPGLKAEGVDDTDATVPERFLHKFFSGMGVPYRAYEADDPQSLQQAIRDVDRLENLPLSFTEVVPKRALSWECYALALALVVLLLAAKLTEVKTWR
jgi:mxaC protein